jgi:protease-4
MIVVPSPPSRSSGARTFFLVLLILFLLGSVGLNFVLFLLLVVSSVGGGWESDTALRIHHHAGKKLATDKIAVIKVEGVLMEGLASMSFAEKQIEAAAKDDHIKAVVVRINSPGGTITASDDLFKRLKELHLGNKDKETKAKPLVVSMGSLAASGGYYIAMPAQHIVAERSTITGSIGVYASFLNIAKLADQYGIRMETIKAGAVKDSGSMFHHMTPQERKIWQDMVDHAYRQFIEVVEEGRPKLKGKLASEVVIKEEIPESDGKGEPVADSNGQTKKLQLTRVRADGGIFTADKAKELGLVDQIGYLDDAIAEAHKLAKLGSDYEVITYEKPFTLLSILSAKERPPESSFDAKNLAAAAMPRLWYLAPQSDLTGLLAASKSE